MATRIKLDYVFVRRRVTLTIAAAVQRPKRTVSGCS